MTTGKSKATDGAEMKWAIEMAASKTIDQIINYVYAPNSAALGHALQAELRRRIAAPPQVEPVEGEIAELVAAALSELNYLEQYGNATSRAIRPALTSQSAELLSLRRKVEETEAERDELKRENKSLSAELDALEEEGCSVDDDIRKLTDRAEAAEKALYLVTNERDNLLDNLAEITSREVSAERKVEETEAERLYDGNAYMADGEVRMTAAEGVLAWLLIEKLGCVDDVNYTPNDAQKTIANRLDYANEMEEKLAAAESKVEALRALSNGGDHV